MARLTGRQARIVAGLAAPPLAAALLHSLSTWVPNTDAALIMVVVVVAVAVTGDRVAATLAAVSVPVWFDFFLTVPFFRFAISSSQDIQTTVLLLLVGLSVTEIAVRSAAHRRVATEEAAHLALISSVSAQALGPGSTSELVERVRAELRDLLGVREVSFIQSRVQPRSLPLLHRDGRVEWGDGPWPTQEYGLPEVPVELPLHVEGEDFGAFLVTDDRHAPVPRERLIVAGMLADQVAASFALHA